MASGFSVTISAVDNATAAIDKVNARIAALTKPVLQVKAAADKLAGQVGLTQLARRLGDATRAATEFFRQISRVVTPLAAITSAASVAGMMRLASAWGQFAARLGLDAQRIRIAASNLHALQGAARLAGASADAMTAGMRTLGDTLVDAAGGRNNEAVQYLNMFGIALVDATGHGHRRQ